MSDILDNHLMSEALDFVGAEARHLVMDAVYCALANSASDLEGNTAETDVNWFAFQIWGEARRDHNNHVWENVLSEDEREHWRTVARACLDRLPFLMSRMANRCRRAAEVANTLARAERKRLREVREARRGGK